MSIHLYKNDLPDGLDLGPAIAVDTETQGLKLQRDRLCLIQLSAGDGVCHMVQFPNGAYDAPQLKRLLADRSRLKIMHYARFDMAVIRRHLGVDASPVFCTKIASRLTRTYTDRHGLAMLCKELLGVDLSKEQQSSDWANPDLSESQLSYAANDVLYLHRLKEIFDARLEREGRMDLAQACFDFLPGRAALDLAGWEDEDLLAYA